MVWEQKVSTIVMLTNLKERKEVRLGLPVISHLTSCRSVSTDTEEALLVPILFTRVLFILRFSTKLV